MLKGKALMIGVKIGEDFHTVAYAKSHRLDMSAQTGEVSSKDHNDKSVVYEITGMGWSVSTDNLVEDDASLVACGYSSLKALILAGLPVSIHLRYFEDAVGKDSLEVDNDWYNWDIDSEVVISGETNVTSLNLNAPNKQNATYSATFTGKGEFTIGE